MHTTATGTTQNTLTVAESIGNAMPYKSKLYLLYLGRVSHSFS